MSRPATVGALATFAADPAARPQSLAGQDSVAEVRERAGSLGRS